MKTSNNRLGWIGLSSVLVLVVSILVFGFLNTDFHFVNDFISKLGAKGEPYSVLFNIIGFVIVGMLASVFGFLYGRLMNDKLLSILFLLFGLGYASIAIPIDMKDSESFFSKMHILSVCLGLCFWLIGLSRISHRALDRKIKFRANVAASILVASMVGVVIELWSMPVTHRLVFMTVFGWISLTSIELIRGYNNSPNTAPPSTG